MSSHGTYMYIWYLDTYTATIHVAANICSVTVCMLHVHMNLTKLFLV